MSNCTINENLIKSEPVKKVRDHRGQRNPHYNKSHSPASKDAIAKSQKARFDFYKRAAANIMTEERVREIITETIRDFLSQNIVQTNNNKPTNIPLG